MLSILVLSSEKPPLLKWWEYVTLEGFQYVLGTEERNFKHKPNPEIINYIMDKLNVSKEDTVIIGDSKSDILTAKNAEIDTIAVTYGYDTIENLAKTNPTYM